MLLLRVCRRVVFATAKRGIGTASSRVSSASVSSASFFPSSSSASSWFSLLSARTGSIACCRLFSSSSSRGQQYDNVLFASKRYNSTFSKIFGGKKKGDEEIEQKKTEEGNDLQQQEQEGEENNEVAFSQMESATTRPDDVMEFVINTYDELFTVESDEDTQTRPLPSMEEKFLLLAECEFAFGFSVPSSVLMDLNTAESVAKYIETAIEEEKTSVFGHTLKEAHEDGTLPPNIVIDDPIMLNKH
eukprot:m.21830 g.21830  ORF g.21830 m.21830 type:complete len:245 (+) comp8762_c0_seq1:53-787(+)